MIALLLAASLIMSQEDPPAAQDIERLEAERDETEREAAEREAQADEIAQEIAGLQARLVDAAQTAREREAGSELAQARLMELEDQEARLLVRLEAERESLIEVLAALQRIEMGAPPALAVNPDEADEAARAAGLLANIAPRLQARADTVRARLEALRELRRDLTGQRENVAAARDALSRTREEIETLIAERQDAERRLREEADDLSAQAGRIAARADTLRDLLAEIHRFAETEPRLNPRRTEADEAETAPERALAEAAPSGDAPFPRLKPERASDRAGESPPTVAQASRADIETRSADEASSIQSETLLAALPSDSPDSGPAFGQSRGRIAPPAGGRLIVASGEEGPDGAAREGVWFETAQGAQVVAPFDGVVVYSGAFQSFEGVLMINTADGYTLILGGIGLLYASEGQSVLAGEPVGSMASGGDSAARLYFEIRRDADTAEDPAQWLRAGQGRG